MMRTIQETEEQEESETEITLGMKSLLGVFFGLVLICGVFFGLGYSLGRGSSRPAPETASEVIPKVTAKPAPLPPAATPTKEGDSVNPPTYTPGPDATEPVSAAPPRKPSASVVKVVPPEPATETAPAPAKPAPGITSPATATASAAPGPQSATQVTPSMVQIAAISKQEDADVLVAALKKRGYSAVVHSDPKDNLLHVQIGPFATRDEARAMRAKLLADGYNAILK